MFQAAAWIILGIFSLIRLQADYLLVIGVCLSLSIANIIGFTKCKKGVTSSAKTTFTPLMFQIVLKLCALQALKSFSLCDTFSILSLHSLIYSSDQLKIDLLCSYPIL